jgi:hypothetical protein
VDNVHPTRLKLSIGGMGSETSGTLMADGGVLYERLEDGFVPTEHATVQPTNSQWHAFWSELGRLGVWDWRRTYFAWGIDDGTQWKVQIDRAGRSIAVSGSNQYPMADGKPNRRFERTDCFRAFCVAVSRLVGGRSFG